MRLTRYLIVLAALVPAYPQPRVWLARASLHHFPQVADFRSQTGPKERAGTLSHASSDARNSDAEDDGEVPHRRELFVPIRHQPKSSAACSMAAVLWLGKSM